MLREDQRIKLKRQLREWLIYELNRYPKGSRYKFFLISENDILKRHQVLLRKTEYHLNAKHRIRGALTKLKLFRLQNKFGLHIPLNCCGKGLKIVHLGPILINGKCTVGENCIFHINTALVAGGTNDDVPTLGNNVLVGIGATILGGVAIADGVAIGAGAVVNKDVSEADIAVAGVPAKKISNKGSRAWENHVRSKNL
ncbi:MAG: serine acetyltransferase [Clostridia bacterium]|nr:serine acetyltransferase [Clostridia bacterium]